MTAAQKGSRAPKKPDPIFALIATHAKAVKAERRATESLSRLTDRLNALADKKREHSERRLTCATPLFDIGPKYDPVVCIRSRAQLTTHVFDAFDRIRIRLGRRTASHVQDLEREAVAELLRRYDRFQREHRAKRKAAGLTARENAVDAAHRGTGDALKPLLNCASTTPEGRKAMIAHITSLGPEYAPWWVMKAVLERLAA